MLSGPSTFKLTLKKLREKKDIISGDRLMSKMILFSLFSIIHPNFGLKSYGTEKKFQQTLDHYQEKDLRKFDQRYFENLAYYDGNPGRPILLYIGGESEFSEAAYIQRGSITKIAKETNAIILGLEHRFFGNSQPFPYLNKTSMEYLTVDQALADIAAFLSFARLEYCSDSTCDVLVIGGSYPGALSSWFRLYYPHIANYSWASSAPVNIKLLFPEYDELIANVLKEVDDDCFTNTKLILSYYHNQIVKRNRTTFQEMKRNYGFTDDMDMGSVLSILSDVIYYAVQYDNNYNLIRPYCAKQNGHEPSFEAYIKLFHDVQRTFSQTTHDMDPFSLTDEDPYSKNAAMRAWTWMTCNELGWFANSAGFQSPWVNQTFYEKVCKKLFKIDVGFIRRSAFRYGSNHPRSSYVIFSNGKVDPWSALGVESVSSSNQQYSYHIEGASHCSDMKDENPLDTEDLKKTRAQIIDRLVSWLNHDCQTKCHKGTCLHEFCLCDVGWGGEYCTFSIVSSEKLWLVGIVALLVPLMILIIVGGAAWWLFRKLQEEQFLLTLTMSRS